ncbi:chemotaxis protein CheZ [Novimethylophilus kurashikiensis]|uniref:Protein phosphatase CheZ n=1 Tax=Novimethylophilus kurashikiensis TaxID=1825523 RepID=A0A2R5F6R0_9PROT|nr:protein phosphatase CheZ [Novimethylophilus kurashikiensis]GBG13942.1 chemotaxis protein CheZ [Novimethylophilus kurashikiensis]
MTSIEKSKIIDPRVERIGRATARLHKLLKELGHTRTLQQSAATMPDARDRLCFIDKAMHEASEKTISAVEASLPLTDNSRNACSDLAMRLSAANFAEQQDLIAEAVSAFGEIASNTERVHHNLMQIMEAQEFRDVAGQMVNKVVGAAVEIEHILLDILKEYAPDAKDSLISKEGLTAGPNLKAEDSVNGQDEVDDLLASLGL